MRVIGLILGFIGTLVGVVTGIGGALISVITALGGVLVGLAAPLAPFLVLVGVLALLVSGQKHVNRAPQAPERR
jgi:hypothetical protein